MGYLNSLPILGDTLPQLGGRILEILPKGSGTGYNTLRYQAGMIDLGTSAADEIAGASFGNATSNDYRATFFAANPELQGKVVVHHAVERQVLTRFPGVVTNSELHSLENLRGIPVELNNTLHLSDIRVEWNRFYKPFIASGTSPTQTQLLQKATEIDIRLGAQFNPPVNRGK